MPFQEKIKFHSRLKTELKVRKANFSILNDPK